MYTYLGMQVEHLPGKIRLHLNKYIRETLDEREYKVFQTKSLRPKLVLIQSGLVLDEDDCQVLPDPRTQK
jgi:hypothetical protein